MTPPGGARPFRFGVQAQPLARASVWTDRARRAEDLGYSTLLIHDHVGDQLAPLPALTMAAAVTTELRVGTLVLDNDFRHPALLANEIATVDVLSAGRFEWGIGAGWLPRDYERSGLTFDPPAARLARLRDSIAVMKALFGEGEVDVTADRYHVQGFEGAPRPVQRPHPPLLVGGQGRRLLSLAAREADIVGIGPSISTKPLFGERPRRTVEEAMDEQLAWIREAAGERFTHLELNLVALPTAVVDDRAAAVERLASTWEVEPAQVDASPHVLLGSVEEMCEQLEARRARWGISYYVVPPNALEDFSPVVERLSGR